MAVACGGPTTGWLKERRIPPLTVGFNHSCTLAHSYSKGNILKLIHFKQGGAEILTLVQLYDDDDDDKIRSWDSLDI